MSSPPSSANLSTDDGEWDDGTDDVPVLLAPEEDSPRVVLPLRRNVVEEAPARVEEGFRIESRIPARVEATESPAGIPRMEVTELGKSVVRLESEPTPAAVARQDTLPVMQRRERGVGREVQLAGKWGQKRAASHRWILWAGAAVVVVIVTGLAIQPYLSGNGKNERNTLDQRFEVVEDVVNPDDPTVYFSQNQGEIVREMQATLTAYAHAKTLDEAGPLIRDSARLMPDLKKKWKAWDTPPDWEPDVSDGPGFDSVGRRPYGIINGTGPDFSPFHLFFVREGDHMLVDWEASTAQGTHTFAKLKDPTVAEAVLRVTISPTAFYSPVYPETGFRSYRIADPNGDSSMWVYAPLDSLAAQTLDEMFRAGTILAAEAGEKLVRIRIRRGPEGSLPNQWLLADVLHKGWVAP